MAQSKAWRLANPERQRELQLASYYRHHEKNKARTREYSKRTKQPQKWAKEHPERFAELRRNHWHNGGREKQAEWNAANPERLAEYQRAYTKRHYQKILDKNHRRRAKLRNAPDVEKIDRLAIYDRDGGVCHICGKKVSAKSFTLDHLVPIARGGSHIATNVRVAHGSCNSRRGADRLPAQLILT